MLVVLSAALILVDLFIAVMKVAIEVSVAITQLEVSSTLMNVKISAPNMWGDNCFGNYAGGSLCCNHAGVNFYSALCM